VFHTRKRTTQLRRIGVLVGYGCSAVREYEVLCTQNRQPPPTAKAEAGNAEAGIRSQVPWTVLAKRTASSCLRDP
jgi:hypothetical protein